MPNWKLIDSKLADFVKKYNIANKVQNYINKGIVSLCEQAALLSYAPSMNIRKKGYSVWGQTTLSKIRKMKEDCIKNIIYPFLSREDYSDNACNQVITEVRDFYYYDNNIYNYTCGNAQKWINMSIKYVFILYWMRNGGSSQATFTSLGYTPQNPYVFNYEYFPVDTTIRNKFIDPNILGVSDSNFMGLSWYECDNIDMFMWYWIAVKIQIIIRCRDYSPILFEIENF